MPNFTKKGAIDVAIITKNRPLQLQECVNKILTNRILPESLIIVDASAVKDAKLARRIAADCQQKGVRLKHIRVQDHGVSYSRNIALKYVEAPYFAFIDDDQYAHSSWLETIRDFFELKNGFDVLMGPSIPKNMGNYWNRVWDCIVSDNYDYNGEVKMLNTGNSAYSTEFIKNKKIKFDQRFTRSSEDRVFYYKIEKNGGRVFYSKNFWVKHDYRTDVIGFVKQWFNYGKSVEEFNEYYVKARRLVFLKSYFPFHPKSRLFLLPGILVLNAAFLVGYLTQSLISLNTSFRKI